MTCSVAEFQPSELLGLHRHASADIYNLFAGADLMSLNGRKIPVGAFCNFDLRRSGVAARCSGLYFFDFARFCRKTGSHFFVARYRLGEPPRLCAERGFFAGKNAFFAPKIFNQAPEKKAAELLFLPRNEGFQIFSADFPSGLWRGKRNRACGLDRQRARRRNRGVGP